MSEDPNTAEGDDEFDARVLAALDNPPVYVPFPAFQSFAGDGFDDTTLKQFVALLQEAKEEAGNEQLRSAVDKATRWAAVDTGAIEGLYAVERGFTFSVAAEAAAWDNMHLHIGDAGKRAIEDALHAYDYVLDAMTESRPITETWIKELHQVICASQESYTVITVAGRQEHALKKGSYKEFANNPLNFDSATVHAYAPVADTAPEMARLVAELRSDAFKKAHPVLQAAYAHYAFVCVHPFADGNGRVARALAAVYLYRSPGVPLVIFADQKPGYIDALEAADGGAYDLFVRFIAERAVDVVRMVADDLRRPVRPSLDERMAEMRQALLGRGGLPHDEIDALSGLLFDELASAFKRALEANPLEAPLSAKVQVVKARMTINLTQYRHPPEPRVLQFRTGSRAPASAALAADYAVYIARGDLDAADFIIVGGRGNLARLEVLIRDLTPTVNPALTYRLDVLAEDQLHDMVGATIEAGEEQLRKSGYRF